MTELQFRRAADFSIGEPDPEYCEYVAERNLCEISESQKLAKLLKEVLSICARGEHSDGLPEWAGKCACNAHAPKDSSPLGP